MARLHKDQVVETDNNEKIIVQSILGEGGQGIVYKVLYHEKEYALKWYSKSTDEKFYNNLINNSKKESPAPTFLWPLAITKKDSNGCFGYIMKLRPDEYKEFSKFLINRVQFQSFTAIVNAAMQITASFRMLHNRGYSYQDLNDGNFFINPTNGDVLICDNDNVAPYKENLGIQGKPRYMAPEIVTLEKKPDSFSDRFSLAVILFLLMFKSHPLMGKADNNKTDPVKNEMNLYCKNPVFIFDPKDDSNRPNPEIHKNALLFWNIFPASIKDEFIKAFDKKLMNSDGSNREDRIIEKEWLKELVRLKEQIIICPNCKEETFVNFDQSECECINCSAKISVPPVFSISKKKISLFTGKQVFDYEFNDDDITVEQLSKLSAEVIANKKNPNICGLKNLSSNNWLKTTPSGKTEEIVQNGVVPVARGIKIKITEEQEGFIE